MYKHVEAKHIGTGPNQINPKLIRMPSNINGQCPITLTKVEELEAPVISIPYGRRGQAIIPSTYTDVDIARFRDTTLTSTCIYEKVGLDQNLQHEAGLHIGYFKMPDINMNFQFITSDPHILDQLRQLQQNARGIRNFDYFFATLAFSVFMTITVGIPDYYDANYHVGNAFTNTFMPIIGNLALCLYVLQLNYNQYTLERNQIAAISTSPACPIYFPVDKQWIKDTQHYLRTGQLKNTPYLEAKQRIYKGYQQYISSHHDVVDHASGPGPAAPPPSTLVRRHPAGSGKE